MRRFFTGKTLTRLGPTMNFEELPEFQRDFRNLVNKYKTLPEDMEQFREIVLEFPLGGKKHSGILTGSDRFSIIKARLSCRYLKGSSLRIIYAYCKTKNRIDFIEIYFKGNKQREDKRRIGSYLGQCSRFAAAGCKSFKGK